MVPLQIIKPLQHVMENIRFPIFLPGRYGRALIKIPKEQDIAVLVLLAWCWMRLMGGDPPSQKSLSQRYLLRMHSKI